MRAALPAALALVLALPAAPAPASPGGDDVPSGWITIRNDSETFEVKVPPDFKEIDSKNLYRVKHIHWSGEPYLSTQVKIYAYQGQNELEHFVKFCLKDIGGSSEFVGDSKSRFVAKSVGSDATEWVSYVDVKVKDKFGYYLEVLSPSKVFETRREDFDRILDSFRTFEAPKDAYTVPAGWKEVRNEAYAVLGPVAEQPDDKAKSALENRLYRVQTWADPAHKSYQLVRDFYNDKRKFVARQVIKVLPTRDAFRKAAGDAYLDGRNAVYNSGDPDRAVVVDGSPESGLDEHDLHGALAVQYMHGRVPGLTPWLREGFRIYWEAASRKDYPGIPETEVLKEAKEVFRRNPPKIEDLLGMDAATLREKGPAGRIASWGFIQYALHGPDEPVRNAFRKFVREAVGKEDLGPWWKDCFPKFKGKDWDKAAAKYMKEREL